MCRRHKKPQGGLTSGSQHAMKIQCAQLSFLLVRSTAYPGYAIREKLCYHQLPIVAGVSATRLLNSEEIIRHT